MHGCVPQIKVLANRAGTGVPKLDRVDLNAVGRPIWLIASPGNGSSDASPGAPQVTVSVNAANLSVGATMDWSVLMRPALPSFHLRLSPSF